MKRLAFILLVLATLAQAGEVKDSCLKDLSTSWQASKDIESNLYRSLFFEESEGYCGCLETHFKKFPAILGINQYFLNDLERFKQEDYCRYQHYQSGSFEVSTLMTQQKLQEEIQERIRRRYLSSIWILATSESIQAKFLCVEAKVNSKCLKTGSGGLSFHCILHTMTDGKMMNKLDSECPEFKTPDVVAYPRI